MQRLHPFVVLARDIAPGVPQGTHLSPFPEPPRTMPTALPPRMRSLMTRTARCRFVRRASLLLRRIKKRIDRASSRRVESGRHRVTGSSNKKARMATRLATSLIIVGGGLFSSTYHDDRPTSLMRSTPVKTPAPTTTKTRPATSDALSASPLPGDYVASCFGLSAIPAAARPLARCWRNAGKRYGIDPLLLVAIGTVETQLRSNTIHINSDGSRDLGLMQINSVHLPRLEQHGVTAAMLLENPCVSIMTGAEILAQNVKRHGYNWDAVGAYNAGSRADRHALRMRYAGKVKREYVRLTQKDDMTRDVTVPRMDIAISLREDPMRLSVRPRAS